MCVPHVWLRMSTFVCTVPVCVCLCVCVCVGVCGRMGGILTYQCCSVTSSLYESGLLKTNWIYGQFGRYLRHGVCVCVCVCVRACV